MKTTVGIVALVIVTVAAATEAGYVAPYAPALDHRAGAYYGRHYADFAAPYAAYYGNPSGTYSYWGSQGLTVVQQNAASHPAAAHALYSSPYSAPYGGSLLETTVVQANHHWGDQVAHGAYGGYGYGRYGYDGKYLAHDAAIAAPLAKYLL